MCPQAKEHQGQQKAPNLGETHGTTTPLDVSESTDFLTLDLGLLDSSTVTEQIPIILSHQGSDCLETNSYYQNKRAM